MQTKFYFNELSEENQAEITDKLKTWFKEGGDDGLDEKITDEVLLNEAVDDFINRHNWSRTLEDWDKF